MTLSALPVIGSSRVDTQRAKFGLFAVLFGAFGVGFGRIAVEAYSNYSAVKATFGNLPQVVPFVNLATAGSIFLGIHVALIVLLFVDQLKRAQSILLGLGTLLGLVALGVSGVFFDKLGALDVVLGGIVFVVTLGVVGGETLRRVERATTGRQLFKSTRSDEQITFPAAERGLFLLLVGFGVVTFWEAHTVHEPLLLVENGATVTNFDALSNVAVTGTRDSIFLDLPDEAAIALDLVILIGLTASTRAFLGYEAERDVVIVGPMRSGKTHALLGMYYRAKEEGRVTDDFGEMDAYESTFMTDRDFLEPNQFGRETDYTELGFEYTVGTYFRQNVTVRGFDYPGELAPLIGEGLRRVGNGDLELPSVASADEITEINWKDVPMEENGSKFEEFADRVDDILDRHTQPTHTQEQPNEEEDSELAFDGGENSEEVNLSDNLVGGSAESEGRDTTDTETESTESDESEGDNGKENKRAKRMLMYVLPMVMNADTLLFVFDADAVFNADAFYDVGFYTEITSEHPRYDTSLSLVTKADVLSEEYESRKGLSPTDDYDKFQQFVSNELDNSEVAGVKQRVGNDPLPVFISSRIEDGDLVPIFTDSGPSTFGFKRLLRRLGGR